MRTCLLLLCLAACAPEEVWPGSGSDQSSSGGETTGPVLDPLEPSPTTGPGLPFCHLTACIDDGDCDGGATCKEVLADDVPSLCVAPCLVDTDCPRQCGEPIATCEAGACVPVTCWRAKPCAVGECRDYVDGISACF